MQKSGKRTNYLSRVPEERRKWPRRQTNFLVRVVFTRKGVKQLMGVHATVVNLSEGGAALVSRRLEAIPQHFYISLGRLEIMIPCAQLSVANDVMRVSFVKDQPTPLVDVLSELRFPLAMLDPIAGSSYASLLRYAGNSVVQHASAARAPEFWRLGRMIESSAASGGLPSPRKG